MPTATTDATTHGTIVAAGTAVDDRATLLASWRARGDAALSAHLAHHGPPPLPGPGDTSWPERFAATVEASGLTGRGGAAFPSSTKLRLVRSARGRPTL